MEILVVNAILRSMNKLKTYEGIIMIRGKGTGFVNHPDFEEDIVIEREALGFALDGDVVKIEIKKKIPGRRQEGKVLEVVKPAYRELIGTVKEKDVDGKTIKYLHPDNSRIHIRPILPEATSNDLNMKVVVEISKWSNPTLDPLARITETIGHAGDHETEMQAIIRSGGFAKTFPESVQRAAQTLHDNQAQIFADALKDPKRRDFRGITTLTIDPADAKDFDDALSCQVLPSGNIEVGIHIADVSHYVRENDDIDTEAKERATSVYLVDRVIPMLPEILSNDLCSLRPNEDRLAFSAVFELTKDAKIENAWYGQTIIHSDYRFSYEDAQKVLDEKDGPYLKELQTMMDLGRILRKKRYQAGAIAFEQPEVKFELDERGSPINAYKKHRTETMLMIEDFMLLANREVATYVYNLCRDKGREQAFVYRTHDTPDPDKLEELGTFLRAIGYEFEVNKGTVKATAINDLLKEIEGKSEENLIKTATIRSMAKAIYSTKNIGHFGLAFKYYTHFTSPIRRYPDLMVHRMLRRHLDNSTIGSKELAKYEQMSIKSSQREMEAVSAERDSIKFKQVEYLMNKVGETFEGVITGVTDWGIYVQEQNTLAEGMVRLSSIKSDYFEHEASKYRIKGQKTGKVYQLGDAVKVKLTRADKDERQLDFELMEK
ncbi:MAG: ribonuclease R [Candidatus Paceibacterota bacterium]